MTENFGKIAIYDAPKWAKVLKEKEGVPILNRKIGFF